MKVLVVGGGGREHALAWKLQQSPRVDAIFCAPGNAGTEELGENVPVQPSDAASLVRFARENQIGLTVVGPDDPLAAGLVDEFQKENLRIFGPTKSAARLRRRRFCQAADAQHRRAHGDGRSFSTTAERRAASPRTCVTRS